MTIDSLTCASGTSRAGGTAALAAGLDAAGLAGADDVAGDFALDGAGLGFTAAFVAGFDTEAFDAAALVAADAFDAGFAADAFEAGALVAFDAGFAADAFDAGFAAALVAAGFAAGAFLADADFWVAEGFPAVGLVMR